MPEDVTRCPLCGGKKSSLFDRREFHNLPVVNRVCDSCGLVFQSPAPTQEEIDSFYRREYRRLYQGEEGPTPKDLSVQKMRAESLRKFLLVHTATLKRHLDIGCSAGLLLQRFQEEFGSQPTGIEPGNAYRAYAGGQGLRVYSSLEELEAAQPAPFDLISMAHVLEHIPDPVRYLEDLRKKHLAQGGYLLIEVPNLYAHDSFEVAHLTAFSSHTLVEVVKKAGYEILAVEAHGRPRSKVLPLYITLLASSTASRAADYYSYTPQPEKSVRLKRRMGMLKRAFWERVAPGRAWLPVEQDRS